MATTPKGPSLGWVLWPAAVLMVLILSLAALVDPGTDPAGVRPGPRSPIAHSYGQIEAAVSMVEQMRAGQIADAGRPGDERHPQDQIFIEELEAYQQAIDRMLGQGAP